MTVEGLARVFDRIEEIRARAAHLAGGAAFPQIAPTPPAASPSPYAAEIEAAAKRHGLDPRLLEAVVRAESAYNPRAVSPKGAQGLMQIMPQTAAMLGLDDPFDPEANLDAGARYLRGLLDRFGDLPRALAAYNAGPAAVERHGGLPPYAETRRFVEHVIGNLDGTR